MQLLSWLDLWVLAGGVGSNHPPQRHKRSRGYERLQLDSVVASVGLDCRRDDEVARVERAVRRVQPALWIRLALMVAQMDSWSSSSSSRALHRRHER
jgi:hypothetical protein